MSRTTDRWWPAIDRSTRAWWRLVGREVDLDGSHHWLHAPVGGERSTGSAWLNAELARLQGRIESSPDAGLIEDIEALAGPALEPASLNPAVRDFYEHTATWRMEAWAQWSFPFGVPGALINRWFGSRVQQLALPAQPLEVAAGIDSRVEVLRDAGGARRGAVWTRVLRSSGTHMFNGYYRTGSVPSSQQRGVHVAFPLEAGNIQVHLRPHNAADGALLLASPSGSFGEPGAYVVVVDGGRSYAARLPLHERFHVYVDVDGVLRTDHELRAFGRTALRLHYKLVRSSWQVDTRIEPE